MNHTINLTSSFNSLLGLHDFYLKTYNEEFLTLKSDAVDGVCGWLLNSNCHSVKINFSTYGNQQEEHCCDANNFSDISLSFSVGALAICASKLQRYGRCMTATEAHTQLGDRFIELSERCHKQINADAVGWWKDEVRV